MSNLDMTKQEGRDFIEFAKFILFVDNPSLESANTLIIHDAIGNLLESYAGQSVYNQIIKPSQDKHRKSGKINTDLPSVNPRAFEKLCNKFLEACRKASETKVKTNELKKLRPRFNIWSKELKKRIEENKLKIEPLIFQKELAEVSSVNQKTFNDNICGKFSMLYTSVNNQLLQKDLVEFSLLGEDKILMEFKPKTLFHFNKKYQGELTPDHERSNMKAFLQGAQKSKENFGNRETLRGSCYFLFFYPRDIDNPINFFVGIYTGESLEDMGAVTSKMIVLARLNENNEILNADLLYRAKRLLNPIPERPVQINFNYKLY